MMMLNASSRNTSVMVRCSSAPESRPGVNVLRKFFDKRSKTAKDHLSRMYTIGTVDFQEVKNVVQELDLVHKQAFEDFAKKMRPSSDVVAPVDDKEDSKSIFESDDA